MVSARSNIIAFWRNKADHVRSVYAQQKSFRETWQSITTIFQKKFVDYSALTAITGSSDATETLMSYAESLSTFLKVQVGLFQLRKRSVERNGND